MCGLIEATARHVHVDDEGMIDAEQDVFLVLYVLDLFESNDVGNGQNFQGPVFTRALLAAENDPAERPSSCIDAENRRNRKESFGYLFVTK